MRRALFLGLAGVLLLAACRTAPRGTDLPPGYVSLTARGNVLRSAVSPTGNRIVLRRHDNPPEGTLEFWRDAVKAELTEGKGYTLVDSQAVTGKDGRPGWEFLFKVTRTEGDYLYLVLVRVERGSVFVTEAGGRAEALDADLPALREALR